MMIRMHSLRFPLFLSPRGYLIRSFSSPVFKLSCSGCGSGLQSRDTAAAGYLPTHTRLLTLEAEAARAKEILASTAATPSTLSTFGGPGVICQRCYRSKHYGKLVPLEVPGEAWRDYAAAIATPTSPTSLPPLLLFVCDVWDFHGSIGPLLATVGGAGLGGGLHKVLHSQQQQQQLNLHAMPIPLPLPSASATAPLHFVLAVNKLDLLPSSTPRERVEAWAKKEVRGLLAATLPHQRALSPPLPGHSSPSSSSSSSPPSPFSSAREKGALLDTVMKEVCKGVMAVSAVRGWGIPALLQRLKEEAGGRDIVVVGSPNTGKSSVINALLSQAWDLPGLQDANCAAVGIVRHKGPSSRQLTPTRHLGSTLPPGLSVGQVVVAGGGGGGSGGPSEDSLGTPVIRRGDTYGSSSSRGVSGSSGSSSSSALDMGLFQEIMAQRKARGKGKEEDTFSLKGGVGKAAAAAAEEEEVLKIAALEAELSVLNGKVKGTTSAAAAAKTYSPPTFPFTASPLPGTTLGVLRAPLDPHGHTFLVDTPGVVMDAEQGGMLKAIAVAAAAVASGVSTTTSASTGDSSSTPPPAAAAKRVLGLTVDGGVGGGKSTGHSHRVRGAGTSVGVLLSSVATPLPIFRLAPGRSLFLGGLVRIDWHGAAAAAAGGGGASGGGTADGGGGGPHAHDCHILATVATRLPLHVCSTGKAEELWHKYCSESGAGAGAGGVDGEMGSGGGHKERTHHQFLWPGYGPLRPAGTFRLLYTVPPLVRNDLRRIFGGNASASGDAGGGGGSGDIPSASSYLPYNNEEEFEDEDKEEKKEMSGRVKDGARGERGMQRAPFSPHPSPHLLPPTALLPGASPSATLSRRRTRTRTSLVDIALPGLGWVSFTPVEVVGQVGWGRCVWGGQVSVVCAAGVRPHSRTPLLPYTTDGTSPQHWCT